MTSVEASALIADKCLDFVFIDAEHTYDACKEDIDAWMPKLYPDEKYREKFIETSLKPRQREIVVSFQKKISEDHEMAQTLLRFQYPRMYPPLFS